MRFAGGRTFAKCTLFLLVNMLAIDRTQAALCTSVKPVSVQGWSFKTLKPKYLTKSQIEKNIDVQYHARLYAYSLLAKRVPTAAINTCTLFALSIPSACQWAQVSDDIGFVQDSIAHRYMASVRANCTVNGKRKTYTLSNYIGDTARFTGCADTSATTTTKQQRAGIGDACQCNQDASSSLQKRRQLKDAALKEAETEVPYFNRRTCKIVSLTQLCRNVQTCVCPGSMIAKDTGSFYGKGVVQCGRGQAVVRHPIVIDENFDAEGSL